MSVSFIYLKALSRLTRAYLSIVVAFSACAGYVYFQHSITWNALFVFTAVAFLSASASALNQYQERTADVLMNRTRSRPLPRGLLTNRHAILAAIAFGLLGIGILYWGTNAVATILGIVTLVWYNGVYTPLKRKTGFASIIGAPTGAFALLIGWAATNTAFNKKALCISLFMILWQVAHFLLLLLKYGKEYESAGFPSLTASVNQSVLKRIIYVWVLATSASVLLFPLLEVITNTVLVVALFIGTTLFIGYFYFDSIKKRPASNLGYTFLWVYLFQTFVLVMLIAQGLLV